MPSKGTAYNLKVTRRQPLTEQNLKELCINTFIKEYIENQQSLLEFAVAYDAKGAKVKPIGISINEAVFGDFPGTAADRGWIAYMNLGEPLIEERSNNTNRLVQVSEEVAGIPAVRIEDLSQLRPEWLAGKKRIAVTAGASTPSYLSQREVA